MILLDSDHVSILVDGRDRRHAPLVKQLATTTEPIAIPVVVVEEHLRGWLAQIRHVHDPLALVAPYGQLVRILDYFSEWDIARWTPSAAQIFSDLRRQRIRIGTQDLRIASIALAQSARLLSANVRDFEMVPDLEVEDWLQA